MAQCNRCGEPDLEWRLSKKERWVLWAGSAPHFKSCPNQKKPTSAPQMPAVVREPDVADDQGDLWDDWVTVEK